MKNKTIILKEFSGIIFFNSSWSGDSLFALQKLMSLKTKYPCYSFVIIESETELFDILLNQLNIKSHGLGETVIIKKGVKILEMLNFDLQTLDCELNSLFKQFNRL